MEPSKRTVINDTSFPGVEQRKFERITNCNDSYVVRITRRDSEQPWLAKLRDVSLGGLGLMVESNVASSILSGEKILCDILRTNKPILTDIPAEIRWHQYIPEIDQTVIGNQFLSLDDNAKELLSELIAELAQEQT